MLTNPKNLKSLFNNPLAQSARRACVLLAGLLIAGSHACQAQTGVPERPNVVLIFADDLGYSDLSCFGSTTNRTPHVDALARQGTRFTNFYVSQAVCTASRASLMTGCYANRVGLEGALNHTSPHGIHPDEQLMPEMFQAAGYKTCILGKWHLGLPDAFSPLDNGFNEWFGIPYSNDNSKYHPVLAKEMPPLPLYENRKVIEQDADQSRFTQRITEHAVDFIERHQQQPFFLYVPHIMPHVPVFASDAYAGRSPHGLYADVIEELDASVGQIVATLDRLKLAENTLVIFTSDNGPFLSYGTHAGRAAPLREGKLTSYEGGVRVPCIMRWPGKIPAEVTCTQPLMTIDLLPTFTAWLRPGWLQHRIDGIDVTELLLNPTATHAAERTFVFYSGKELQAIRQGKWKLHFPHPYLTVDGEPGTDGKPAGYGRLKPQSISQSGVSGIASRHGYRVEQQSLALYDLDSDPAEIRNVASDHAEVVQHLQTLATTYRQDLGDSLQSVLPSAARPVGTR